MEPPIPIVITSKNKQNENAPYEHLSQNKQAQTEQKWLQSWVSCCALSAHADHIDVNVK